MFAAQKYAENTAQPRKMLKNVPKPHIYSIHPLPATCFFPKLPRTSQRRAAILTN